MGFLRNIKRWVKKKINAKDLKYQKHTINIEISSICNAGCSYCPTGVGKHKVATKFMSPEMFEKVIKHLLKINIIAPEVQYICLCSWGEPFLHPQLDEILSILGKYNLKALISSNFIKFPNISDENYKNIYQMIFSICSFDEDNYKKIYKADLCKVLANFDRFIEKKENLNKDMVTWIHWLKYKFNENEFDSAKKYFNERNVSGISDNFYAMLADVDIWLDLKEGKRNPEDTDEYYNMQQAFKDIYFEREQKIMDKFAPEIFTSDKCMQMKILTIGEDAQLTGCCGLYSKHKEYNLGNFLNMDKKKIYELQHSMEVCNRCCKNKLGWYSHNFLSYQDKDIEEIELAQK